MGTNQHNIGETRPDKKDESRSEDANDKTAAVDRSEIGGEDVNQYDIRWEDTSRQKSGGKDVKQHETILEDVSRQETILDNIKQPESLLPSQTPETIHAIREDNGLFVPLRAKASEVSVDVSKTHCLRMFSNK